jgi:hypothetical protein
VVIGIRVMIDGNLGYRGWALNDPFQQLFEFAQPGSRLVLSGVPNRTSYELQLAVELNAWFSQRVGLGRQVRLGLSGAAHP